MNYYDYNYIFIESVGGVDISLLRFSIMAVASAGDISLGFSRVADIYAELNICGEVEFYNRIHKIHAIRSRPVASDRCEVSAFMDEIEVSYLASY